MKKIMLLLVFTAFIYSCSESDSQEPEQQDQTDDQGGDMGGSDDDGGDDNATILPEVVNDGYDLTASDTQGWNLIWEESFSTDLSQWEVWNGGAFNEELQLYTRDNLHIAQGYLFIQERRETQTGITNPFDPTLKSFDFTSGRIESRTTFSPGQGQDNPSAIRMSVRMKVAEGQGLWPAFWGYNDPWPTAGEIDIIEFRGNRPFEYETNFHYGTTAGQLLTDPGAQVFSHEHEAKLSEQFHVYELEWSEEQFVLKFDGNIVNTYDVADWEYVDDLYTKMHRIVLNQAVGGAFFSNLEVSEIPDEAFVIVDWVKVFRQE